MSTKSTIILTNDNEHWFHDCAEPLTSAKDVIVLEFKKENIRIDVNDEEELIIVLINPESDIYNYIDRLER